MQGGLRPRVLAAAALQALAGATVLVAANAAHASGPERPLALTRAYNASGQMLFRMMAARPGNVAFSPYSVGTAMAMVLAGARGDTEREMASVLMHDLPRAQINAANAAALSVLHGYDKSDVAPRCPIGMTLSGERCVTMPTADGSCIFPVGRVGDWCTILARFPPSAKLRIANALMLAQGAVAERYADLLKEKYAAEVFRGAGLDTVNGWVRQKTEGRIARILDRASDTVLLNAVYFKSRWALTFDKKLTKPEFFNLSPTRQELVPTMLQRTRHVVVARKGYRAIRLPYAVRTLAMVVALPDEIDGLDAVADRLDMRELSELLAALRKAPARLTVLSLPRFRTEFAADLKAHFQQAGMKRPFDLARADFSGMTGVPPSQAPMAIDQVVHRAVVEVAEESTEAAAATAVGMVIASAPARPIDPVHFRVDRPFLYFIVDDATGAILFQGRVVDPR
jgi:serpin B